MACIGADEAILKGCHVVITVSGRMGSGKTTLASALARRLQCGHASFGGYVRTIAVARGVPDERAALQELGEALIAELGWERFCLGTLQSSGWAPGASLVIDGVRHAEAIFALRNIVSPIPLVTLFLEVSDETAVRRFVTRARDHDEMRPSTESHSTERQVVGVLPSVADLRVDGSQPVAAAAEEVTSWLARHLLARRGGAL